MGQLAAASFVLIVSGPPFGPCNNSFGILKSANS
jgi:hypothetical protein